MHQCLRCTALTSSPIPDRCGHCQDWPEYDPADPTIGDLKRLAEHLHACGGWTNVVLGLLDAMGAADLHQDRYG